MLITVDPAASETPHSMDHMANNNQKRLKTTEKEKTPAFAEALTERYSLD